MDAAPRDMTRSYCSTKINDGSLTVLVVGPGGRDHALCSALHQSPLLKQLHAAPGNPGIAEIATCHPDVAYNDIDAIVDLAATLQVDLCVVGAEDLLVAGIADRLADAGVHCFGPTAAAAKIEGSKDYAKSIMDDLGIATAAWRSHSSAQSAHDHVDSIGEKSVVKADGLAAGCGAIVCHSNADAHQAIDDLFAGRVADTLVERVIVEEFLSGPEVSIFALSDGESLVVLPPARDYKRLGDGDTGPNTGGMGAHCPSTDISAAQVEEICASIMQPVIDEMRRRGAPFRGALYAGIMLTEDGPSVLEFNCRLGNPETQAVTRTIDADLLELMAGASFAGLRPGLIEANGVAVSICVATSSYPDEQLEPAPVPLSGYLAAADIDGVKPFLGMSTGSVADAKLQAAGGRAVTISAHGDTWQACIGNAYRAVDCIDIPDAKFRSDIGQPALKAQLAHC